MRPPISEPEPSRGAPPAEAARQGLLRAAAAAPLSLAAVLGGALAILLVLPLASLWRGEGGSDLAVAVLSGAVTAFLFAAVGGWLAAKLGPAPSGPGAIEPADPGGMEPGLAAVLAGLETARAAAKGEIEARSRWMVPLGGLAGLACWLVLQFAEEPAGLVELFVFSAIGALAGYGVAEQGLSQRYRCRYKSEVLPLLAARFGALTYRPAETPDLGRLQAEGLLPDFDRTLAEDEIAGRYRGLAVSIVELTLTKAEGKSTVTVFDGLCCTVELPRQLAGATAVVPDEGLFGNVRERLSRQGGERVRLEDPRFEAAYEVYGIDQIAARALLTPAFMERFLALGTLTAFARPVALAVDGRLSILLFKRVPANLFEPPDYRQPADSRAGLAALTRDIEAVLAVADAVIGLDAAAHGFAARSDRAGRDEEKSKGAPSPPNIAS